MVKHMGNKPLEEQELHGFIPKSKPTFIKEKNFILFIICHTVQIFRNFRHQDKENEF